MLVAGAIPLLKPGGRLCVISFHSLEDRIVKQQLAKAAKGCTCPPEFPGVHLRQEAADYPETQEAHPAQSGGAGTQPPRPQRQAACGGKGTKLA